MENFLAFLKKLLEMIFGQIEEIESTQKKSTVQIKSMPLFGEQGDHIKALQKALNANGANIREDGDYGQKTKEAVSVFQKSKGLEGSGNVGPKTLELLGLVVVSEASPAPKTPVKKTGTPWFWKAKEDSGKKETDAAFQEKLNPYWKKAGLPNYKGLVGSARAWCALFVLYALSSAGYSYTKGNASAKSWDNFGQKIEWKVNGFPQGAIVRINSSADCDSWSGNHVTFANGDCTASDLTKPGATFSGYGGNQGNMAKVSTYSAKNICAVRWPSEAELPGKVTTSLNCANGKTADNESTR